jgi:hypothetical protein
MDPKVYKKFVALIREKSTELDELIEAKGISSEETIQKSIELDRIILEFLNLKKQN